MITAVAIAAGVLKFSGNEGEKAKVNVTHAPNGIARMAHNRAEINPFILLATCF
jgi:hypothetical protein